MSSWIFDESELLRSIRTGDHDGELVIDPETGLEGVLKIPALVAFCLVLLSGLYLLGLEFKMVHSGRGVAWTLFTPAVLVTCAVVAWRALFEVMFVCWAAAYAADR